MMEILTIVGTAAISVLWMVLSIVAYARLNGYRTRRLTRCPETGGITVVGLEQDGEPSSEGAVNLRVQSCRLWPGRKNCERGCVASCSRTWGSHGFDLASLMPLEPRAR
ncbi:MAG TPA: hypothetical protein VNN77_15385 [candidate division Zixibacteria bacterium]|nr:hypothetical protein [candidate division Zixibacteria bacterium]